MRIIRRLHWFVLKSFLPLFAMTFFIVLFIVLMQFLWKYIDDLVGKGLSMDVLGELFFYAAVSMVPMALPLAILLASLMTFGNFGEKFELTAMKASGISLIRVMAPLIVLVGGIAVGAFFFQNDVLPHAQVKMWTLLFSMKQKSPELEIPEGVFYDQIPGYNIFVKEKNASTGILYDVMIYDVARGGDQGTILLADSARLAFTPDNKYLFLHLYKGEQFENLRDQSSLDANVPFRRETFFDKQILIPFDANFNRLDDNSMRKQYVGKNITELNQTIDSINLRLDSIGRDYSRDMRKGSLALIEGHTNSYQGFATPPGLAELKKEGKPITLDSLLMRLDESSRRKIAEGAILSIRRERNESEFKALTMADEQKSLRRHEIELLKKYTLSVACMIMFFIGAPLGAIIRKGGLGTPLVISVLLFLVYYIIDNTGYKMARDGRWIVWIGMWMSTFILAPLGIYVTWKAMNDSAVFDKDLYVALLKKALGTRTARKVNYKEIIINDISPVEAISRLLHLIRLVNNYLNRYPHWQSYFQYWFKGFDTAQIRSISTQLEADVTYLTDCRNPIAVNKLIDYPVLRVLWAYHPSYKKWLSWIAIILFPIGIPIWLWGINTQRILKEDLKKIANISSAIVNILGEENPSALAQAKEEETMETQFQDSSTLPEIELWEGYSVPASEV